MCTKEKIILIYFHPYIGTFLQKPLSDDIDVLQAIDRLPSQNQWAIIMLGGGHFAAAIFKGTSTTSTIVG